MRAPSFRGMRLTNCPTSSPHVTSSFETRIACIALSGALLLLSTVVTQPEAASPVGSVGPGEGRVTDFQSERGCEDLLFHADGTYENGYAWQYGGQMAPYFGAFAECYPTIGAVCGAVFDFTQTGNDTGQTMDVYVWADAGDQPGAVACILPGVDPGPIAFWPSLSRHVVPITDCDPGPELWVGYWGDWPNALSPWYIGADLDGPGGCPVSNIAPGIGYPTGWQDVSIVWGPTQAIAIGALFGDGTIEGACCYPDGSCLVQTFDDCTGSFVGGSCDPNPCPQLGACCFEDGSCTVVLETNCQVAGGDWIEGATCDPNPCDQPAACCFDTGDCLVLQVGDCIQAGGTLLPDEPSCSPNPCPQPLPGACCYPGGYCILATIFECQGGQFLGEATSCDPNPCMGPEFGACCFGDGGCALRLESTCDGWFRGAGTNCDPNPCPPPAEGACCFLDGTCQFLTQFACAVENGSFLQDASCDPNPCPQPVVGACCLGAGDCLFVDQTSCVAAGGDFQGEGSSCDPNPCPTPTEGACCLSLGSCEVSNDLVCAAEGGVFQGADSVCEPNPCPQPCVPFALAGRPSATRPAPDFDPFAGGSASRGIDGANRGGTLVLHSDPSVVFTGEDGALCGTVGNVSNCGDIVARADVEDPVTVHAIALFPVSGSPRLVGMTFGIDYPDCVQILDWEACSDFEITDGSWPAPGSGTAITWAVAETDLAVPVYSFLAQGIAAEPGELALAEHPTQGAVFADDSVPSVLDPIAGLGSLGFFRDGVTPCPGALEPEGACCFEDGTCSLLTFGSCEVAGGEFLSVDLPCDPNPCPSGTTGACCLPSDGSCLEIAEFACLIGGGSYLGDGTDCSPNPCGSGPSGACCFGDGSCYVTLRNDCLGSGGSFAGDGSTCDPDPCPATGACCFESGICTVVFQSYCNQIGGAFQGEDVECEAGLCPIPGACCYPDGSCVTQQEEVCDQNLGDYLGDDTVCDPNPCPQPPDGACCFIDGTCQFIDAFECDDADGDYIGEGLECDPNPCPQPPDGACCFVDGSCQFLDAFECDDAGGNYLGEGLECDPNPCPEPDVGACCLPEGGCVVLADYECDELDGGFLGDGTDCDGVLCGVPCIPPDVHYDPAEPGRGPNANGSLVLHTNPSVVFTTDDEYCGTLDINSCAEAIARTDRQFESTVVHVFAAFPSVASPRVAGVTFGISYADCLVLEDWGACGDFELPTAEWPSAGEGTAVAWGTAQTSGITEVYWIAGYVYSFDPTRLDLIPHPTQGANFADDDVPSNLDPIVGLGSFGFSTDGSVPCPYEGAPGACCLSDGSCEVLLLPDCNAMGGEYMGDGTVCDPNPCSSGPLLGACCLEDGSCIVVSEFDCFGDYQGDDTVCDPNPCPQPPEFGACCFADGSCVMTDPNDCTGSYQGNGTVCDPNPCPIGAGACCIGDVCQILSPGECSAEGGDYLGDSVPCEPNPCQTVPTVGTSWGQLKERFRR